MKKAFISIVAAALALLCSCSYTQDDKAPPSDSANRLISTDNIQYNGWRGFISDADYVNISIIPHISSTNSSLIFAMEKPFRSTPSSSYVVHLK